MTTITESRMPAPRLELRWRATDPDDDGYTVECVYALVLALREFDIRAERVGPRGGRRPNATEHTVVIGITKSTGTVAKRFWPDADSIDTPFRDGAHPKWDAAQLGNLPIYAVAEGRAMLVANHSEERS